MCELKLGSLAAWRYTSDLFTYDQVLAETLAGRPGLEYTYGNTFGDHAYPLLLLLVPLKLVLGPKMVVALLLLPPLAHLAAAIGAVMLARRSGADTHVSLVSGLVLLLPPGIVEGLYQSRYGSHPMDELAGPLAIAMTLAWRLAAPGSSRRLSAAALLALLAFVCLKEEMAVLGIVFCGALLLFERSRTALAGLLLATVALAAELVLMRASATPFNDRTMGSGADEFLERLRSGGLDALAAHAKPEAFALVSGLLVAFGIAAGLSRRLDRHAVALLAVGIVKLGLALVVRHDLDLTTWHNYPAVVMLTGALFAQLAVPGAPPRRMRTAAWVVLGLTLASFAHSQVPFVRKQLAANATSLPLAQEYGASLEEIAREIEPESVVAIAPSTAAAWALRGHHRFTFYPRGVTASPRGIADYVVLQSRQVKIRSWYTPPRSRLEIERAHPEFRLIRRNSHFLLLKRIAWTTESRASRDLWVERFGARSLGDGNLWIDPALGAGPPRTQAP